MVAVVSMTITPFNFATNADNHPFKSSQLARRIAVGRCMLAESMPAAEKGMTDSKLWRSAVLAVRHI
jgi:hypothetical protein